MSRTSRTIGALALLALIGAAVAWAVSSGNGSDETTGRPRRRSRRLRRRTGAQEAPARALPSAASRSSGFGTALGSRSAPHPAARSSRRLGWRTPFDSRTVLAVFRHHGAWAGVPTPLLPNGQLGWVKLDPSRLRAGWTRYTIDVDLSSRAAQLRRGNRVLRSFTVTVGAPGSHDSDGPLRDHGHLSRQPRPRLRLLRPGHHRDPAAPALRVVRRRPDRDPRHLRAARHRRLARLRAGREPEREPARQPGPAWVAGRHPAVGSQLG